jgi:hypothetical protein
MNWHQSMTIVDGRLYAGDRWLGSFSSHSAALAGSDYAQPDAAVLRAGAC